MFDGKVLLREDSLIFEGNILLREDFLIFGGKVFIEGGFLNIWGQGLIEGRFIINIPGLVKDHTFAAFFSAPFPKWETFLKLCWLANLQPIQVVLMKSISNHTSWKIYSS